MEKKIDFGGNGLSLLFLHANAYTPECYQTFLEPLKAKHKIHLYRQRALWPNESPDQLTDWNIFADDLIQMMDDNGDSGVIGLGHSLGGIATWLASMKRPDLFSQLILIDPVIIPYWPLKIMSLSPQFIRHKLFPLVKIAENRRNKWTSRDEARSHLGSKKVYKRFDDRVFTDFINHALRETSNGSLTLSYPREWEAKVYATGPNMWSYMTQNIVPVHIIKAQNSDVITADSWKKIQQKVPNGTFYEMSNVGHLIPFEKPNELATHVSKILDS